MGDATGHRQPSEPFALLPVAANSLLWTSEIYDAERYYLWRAFDHEGNVLTGFVTNTRDKTAALKFLRKAMRTHGRAGILVTDTLRSY